MRRAAVLGAFAVPLLVAQPALAVTIGATDTAVVYTAEPGELNRASIAPQAGDLRILESSDRATSLEPAAVVAQAPCRLVREPGPGAAFARRALAAPSAPVAHGFPALVDCPSRPGIVVQLGDEADGFGVDRTITADVRLDAGPGDDGVATGAGRDEVIGGPGRDQLAGGAGPDRLDGGPGADAVRYDYDVRRRGVVAALDRPARAGSAEDGAPRTGDTLVGFEHLTGTVFADRLTGDRRANELSGAAGPDVLDGGRGSDLLADGPGRDRVRAGPGSDRVESRDGDPDRISCDRPRAPRGDDAVLADGSDRVGSDCDAVAVATSTTFGPAVEIARRATVTSRGAVLVRVSCVLLVRCAGRLVVESPAGARLGGRRVTVAPGRTAAVAVTLRRAARPRLRRGRSTPLRARMSTDAGGPTSMRTTRRLIASRR